MSTDLTKKPPARVTSESPDLEHEASPRRDDLPKSRLPIEKEHPR